MLKTRYLKINVQTINDNRYLITAEDEAEELLDPGKWKSLLFHRHEESYFGTVLDIERHQGILGIAVNGWQLATLFAKEQFNRLIEWDWNETAELCIAAAPAVHEAIVEKDWIPDFAAWEQESFQWALPERVYKEFDPSFWEHSEPVPVRPFIHEWFARSLDAYLSRNRGMKELFEKKLEILKSNQIDARQLAEFFDEDRWAEWIGIKEDTAPFTIGLRLQEPEEVDDEWSLGAFLRDKNNPDTIVDVDDRSAYPHKWKLHAEKIDRELERFALLVPSLNKRDRFRNTLSEEEAWFFLTETSELLLALGVEILLPAWWHAMQAANLKIKARLKGTGSHRPSFVGLSAIVDYDWRFSMNGVDLSEEEFSKLVAEKRRLVYIRGRWIKLDPQFIRQIQDLMKKAEKEGLHVRDLLEQQLATDEDEAGTDLENPKAFARIQIELNRQWKQMIKQLSEIKEIPAEPVPEAFNGELRPYQVLGMSWLLFLRKYGFGAVLADDMGLGKTVQLISYLLTVKAQENSGAALIVCPTSVLGNWQKELEKFSPGLNVYLHYGPNRLKGDAFKEKSAEADVVLTSYGLINLDLEDFESLSWSSISIDEAQNIKNAQTKQSRAVRKLKGLHHIALTGTPMENRLSELWSIFDFTNHGYLGNLGQFQKRFVIPIEKDDKQEKVKELQRMIRPFLLRRTKKDEEVALNLPDKLEQKEYCPLTAEQASLYEQLIRDTFAEIEQLSGLARKGLILQMLSRLKQLCNHPALYLKEQKPQLLLERSVKLEKLAELVEAVLEQKESCLIFTQYIEMGEIIRTLLEKKYNLKIPFLNGSVPKNQRDDMIQRFQEHEFPVFLLSLKAGGTGLNLTAANHVIHYDRWWNPAVENQATDRAYRIGQKRFVHVHKLISTGTLEEKIDAMLEKKQTLNDQVIQSESWITEMSTDDLRELVHLT
ncbi:DEAD/DEAH box helicase [Bacillus sp. V33-4]|uniref:DEAD/DEAH box helicase n=1 Tax=Bacillus sp. V33-4 TaxID=2054169 RepID=UPI000C79538A|nr:DEAD/DEAH box helicase [Bacillus sp. V33-4]PLR85434.1 ATP-dependent helicase [Bacillus sp. V33-4]